MKKKRIKIAVLLVAAALLLAIIGYLFYQLHERDMRPTDHIPGTYQTEHPEINGRYLVFKDDGHFLFYRQFAILTKGTYKREGKHAHVYILFSSDGKKWGRVVLYGEKIYLTKKDGFRLFEMNKMSDESMYINVQEE